MNAIRAIWWINCFLPDDLRLGTDRKAGYQNKHLKHKDKKMLIISNS